MDFVYDLLIVVAGGAWALSMADATDRRFYPAVGRFLVFAIGGLTMLLILLNDPATPAATCPAPAGVWL